MSQSKYKLVNPDIPNFKSFDAISPIDAARHVWENLSSNFAKTPKFAFTLKDSDNDILSHFCVKEKQSNGNTEVKYSIIKLKNNDSKDKAFLDEYNKNNTKIGGQNDLDENYFDYDEETEYIDYGHKDSENYDPEYNEDEEGIYGGKHKNDSSSSSSDHDKLGLDDKTYSQLKKKFKKLKRDNFYINSLSTPLYWWYYPYVYPLSSVCIPRFTCNPCQFKIPICTRRIC